MVEHHRHGRCTGDGSHDVEPELCPVDCLHHSGTEGGNADILLAELGKVFEERLYIAWLVKKMFQIPHNRIISAFKCNASSFRKKFHALKYRYPEDRFQNLNKQDFAKLKRNWKQWKGNLYFGFKKLGVGIFAGFLTGMEWWQGFIRTCKRRNN